MTNAEFREVLEDRTAKYAVEVFKYLRERPYDVSTKVIAHQRGKSASSIGANYHEANRSESRDDFVHKVAIAVKEANELPRLRPCGRIYGSGGSDGCSVR